MIFDASVSGVILGLRFGVLQWLRPAVQLGLRMQPVVDEKRCRGLEYRASFGRYDLTASGGVFRGIQRGGRDCTLLR